MENKDKEKKNKALCAIFKRANMSDLPVMSSVAKKLLSLTSSPHTSGQELAEAIRHDYSLTNKILKIANSSFYRRGKPVNSVLRSITSIGFDAVKNLALSVALFEDFLKFGIEKDKIIDALVLSYLSAFFGQCLTRRNKLSIPEDDVFICSLLYMLGKIIIMTYCPKQYKEIEGVTAKGFSEDRATKNVLHGLVFSEVGMDMARHWNFSEIVINSMAPNPSHPRNINDTPGLIHNVAYFSNQMVGSICNSNKLLVRELMIDFQKVFSITEKDIVSIFQTAQEVSATFTSNEICEGFIRVDPLVKLKSVYKYI